MISNTYLQKRLVKLQKKRNFCEKAWFLQWYRHLCCSPWPQEAQGAQGPQDRAPGSPRDPPRDLQISPQRPQGPPGGAPGSTRDSPEISRWSPRDPRDVQEQPRFYWNKRGNHFCINGPLVRDLEAITGAFCMSWRCASFFFRPQKMVSPNW